ncbi:MAG: imidazole glycerol phosphate synthase subunit HisH, partial [Polyangiaceae bacterium]|nr:imidazole glycerol phosphate synthase subunit HisH [Polyangiaceae bacterium]
TSDHGGPFVAALERGPVLACQFHPELSGRWGQALIERWLASGA